MAKLENKNGKHIDVPTMLTGNVRLFDANCVHETMESILKEVYVETANDPKLQECKTVSDAVSCTASEFRQKVLDKLEEKF